MSRKYKDLEQSQLNVSIVPKNMPILTVGGKDHQYTVLLERRTKMFNRLQKQIDLVTSLLVSTNMDMVNTELINIDRLFFDVIDVNTKLEELHPGNSELAIWMSEVDDMVFEIKKIKKN